MHALQLQQSFEKDCRKATRPGKKPMQDALNTLMLVCASLASMAFGVLVAYWLCRCGFAILRIHARSVALANAGVRPGSVAVVEATSRASHA
jgi:hypothetical protein